MANPTLTIQRQTVDWPLGQTLTDQELVNRFGIQATSNGNNITDKVTFNTTQVNVNQMGQYPVAVTVMDSMGQTASARLTLNVVAQRGTTIINNNNNAPAPSNNKKHYGLWIALAIIIVILLAWWGISAHNRNQAQEANNAQQSSQISDNSSSINKLSSDNQKLARQVAALRAAAKQYEKDHDQAELQNRLNDISNQNQQIQSQLHSDSAQQKLQDINQVVNQVQQDPSNASSTVNNLKNKDGFDELWSSITSQVQSWLNKYQNSSN
ncbi:hypothetical protein FD27_GL000628 [Limosilactobacillus frumenti DSM 13145]|uniref:Pesticidal crystal protein Cry22Aa Ig-like domain-containing protein n=1 Tax=Limosilactobacillus frumenti DSM 13145 TaxID=1423746 RepID=A0A0R1P5K4_9LACO|nr:immunoglobulin-like domain-containing protein [Limosilactobacillus frumenti]KRL27886.1 hypothetical protein FD27_GL000628 [Limosilactobacillus frumenti DSM 13145]MBA2914331.1 DUF5011 domain-containing protein [Limosilactobacillus frumenti]QFG71912.1 DUF5011 domain-containing protein [Limosilactobacillus frumenti]